MAYTTIDDPSAYFNTSIWSGDNASSRSFTGLGFSPDWTWIKSRSDGAGHGIFDSVRGVNKRLDSGGDAAEVTNHQFGRLSSFDSDGFTLEEGTYTNYESGDTNMTGRTYVGWSWRASDSNAVSNTTGSIDSSVSVNTDAGFSIVTYTGTGSNATVGHGLGKVPAMMIIKNRSASANWIVYNHDVGNDNALILNGTNAAFSAGDFQSTTPTSSIFSIGTSTGVNGSGNNIVAYCFAEIKGYSKIGTYTGNGTGSFGPFAGGTFVHTGFKPAWLMIKRTDGTNGWTIFDSVRDPFNIVGNQLSANAGGAEEGDASHHAERDFLANGFKLKGNGNDVNADGANYLYMAFAEQPFVSSNGVPTTAR